MEKKQNGHERFVHERTRLVTRLGEVTEGGIVEQIQPIGAASVLEEEPDACVDIGISAWPFPLGPEPFAALEKLGYTPVAGWEGAPEQRLLHSTGRLQLFVVEAGSPRWTDHLVLRDYLCADALAREEFRQERGVLASRAHSEPDVYSEGKARLLDRILAAARRWRIETVGFAPLDAVVRELQELACPWHVSSGWAIDLFLGRVNRVHHDVDITVCRADQLVLQAYMCDRGWKWVTPFEQRLEPWPPQMRLELPRHQAHAHRDGDFIDFLLTEMEGETWRFRRDRSILRTMERFTLKTEAGLTFLAPEVVLLYKSRSSTGKLRDKDQEDFEQVYGSLDPERRAWLVWALTVLNPEHPWLARLASPGAAEISATSASRRSY